jgi:2-deoxy-D-gluconate 3-dehydrogenase
MDEWDWHRTIDVNLGGSFFTMQQVGRAMRQQGGGVITNLAGRISQDQLPKKNQAAYLASQMGLVGLTLEAAKELSVYNIRVNVVCLGMRHIISFPADPALEEEQRRNRPELFERILGMVLYLCGPAAESLTGQVVNLDSHSVV